MKITRIDEQEKAELGFPCLMESKRYGIVILVKGEGKGKDYLEGTVISGANSTYSAGDYSEQWWAEHFEPYFGEIKFNSTKNQ